MALNLENKSAAKVRQTNNTSWFLVRQKYFTNFFLPTRNKVRHPCFTALNTQEKVKAS